VIFNVKHFKIVQIKVELEAKYKNALINFAKLFNEAKLREKHALIYPIRIAGLTLNQAKELGFKASFKLWQSCLDQRKRNKSGFFRIFQNNKHL